MGESLWPVSICFSKDLEHRQVGHMWNKEQMYFARRHRKAFGGGMRQAGVIAADGIWFTKQRGTNEYRS